MSPKQSISLLEQELTQSIIGIFYRVHRELGFGFREFIYSRALEKALVAKGHRVGREISSMVYFRGEPLAQQLLDMIVDERVVIEIKSTEQLHAHSTAQLFSYLGATQLEVGLVLHFGYTPKFHRVIFENRLKRRIISPSPDPPSP